MLWHGLVDCCLLWRRLPCWQIWEHLTCLVIMRSHFCGLRPPCYIDIFGYYLPTLPKKGNTSIKGNLQLCQNYRTISLISHPSKVMLKVILNRLKPQAENIIAEEQAGFRAGHSTTEKNFNLRILCEMLY